jgi:hypothetical protein
LKTTFSDPPPHLLDQARKILLAEIDGSLKQGKANDKTLDELGKHLIQLANTSSREFALSPPSVERKASSCLGLGEAVSASLCKTGATITENSSD